MVVSTRKSRFNSADATLASLDSSLLSPNNNDGDDANNSSTPLTKKVKTSHVPSNPPSSPTSSTSASSSTSLINKNNYKSITPPSSSLYSTFPPLGLVTISTPQLLLLRQTGTYTLTVPHPSGFQVRNRTNTRTHRHTPAGKC